MKPSGTILFGCCLSMLLLGACTRGVPEQGEAGAPAPQAGTADGTGTADGVAALPAGPAAGIAELPTGTDAPTAEPSDGPPWAEQDSGAGLPPAEAGPTDGAAGGSEGEGASRFVAAEVPESTAVLPPFPLLEAPEGLQSAYRETEREMAHDGQYFLAGDRALLVEGRIFRDKFHLGRDPERPYTALQFHRHYADAVAALGGRRIDRVQYTRDVAAAAGGRSAIEKHQHGAVAVPEYRHDSYLLRNGGREYWIDVSTGAIPLHGYVVVLEREADGAAGAGEDESGAEAGIGTSAGPGGG
ncbi:hypothetical protein H0E84_15415 [Luteimonas sp. SJ-92]|uniref:Uncharacterized protein n=1 Tax=Luteimonas salinisoli TaxID=2752307 RepID=A0A853JEL3_9GAMM|nr:hypothetical protein [Luteimonas salinisoli]NZA27766.1 hypothetical protein [Luteimonas salinisoli]